MSHLGWIKEQTKLHLAVPSTKYCSTKDLWYPTFNDIVIPVLIYLSLQNTEEVQCWSQDTEQVLIIRSYHAWIKGANMRKHHMQPSDNMQSYNTLHAEHSTSPFRAEIFCLELESGGRNRQAALATKFQSGGLAHV